MYFLLKINLALLNISLFIYFTIYKLNITNFKNILKTRLLSI